MKHRVRTLLALAAALLVADQLVQHTVLADGVLFGHFVAPFDPPLFCAAQRDALDDLRGGVAGDEQYLKRSQFDPELGWCPRPGSSSLNVSYDAWGARVGARPHGPRPAAGARRALALGCSFTMGMEVADAQAWTALVEAAQPALEVVNLGVAGFGADQAYLRYLRDGRGLGAEEVWIGFMPEGALRVSTQYAPTYIIGRTCMFKPRFVPDPGSPHGVRLVPSPAHDLEQALRLLTDQEAFLSALGTTDLWVRRTPAAFAPRGRSPAHWFATTRVALTLYERRGRNPAAWLRDQDSEIYRVVRGVVLALQDACTADGARLRLAVLPSRPDLEGAAYWEGLLSDLRAAGVECLDISPALRAAGGAGDPGLWMPLGHYSRAGNAVVADAVMAAWR